MDRDHSSTVDLHPEHARAVLRDLAFGLIMLDKSGRVSWANDYAAQLLGEPLAQLLGRAAEELGVPLAERETAVGELSARVAVCGSLVGITQPYEYGLCRGSMVMVFERGHTLVGFLTALASGVSGEIAANGVLSKAAIKGRLEAEVSRSRRYANPLSCLVLRVDDDAGIAVSATARTLKSQLRWVDVLGAWDHDLLLAILPETEQAAAGALGAKLVEALRLDGHRAPDCAVSSWRRGDSAGRMVQRAVGGLGTSAATLSIAGA